MLRADDTMAGLSLLRIADATRCEIGGERDNVAVLEIGRRLRHQRAERAAAALLFDKEPQLIGKVGFGLAGKTGKSGIGAGLVVTGQAGGRKMM